VRHRLAQRVGRRGAALMIFAFIDLVIGWSLAGTATRAQASALPTYRAHVEILPLIAWGWLWIAVGAVCLVHAFRVSDRFGFAAAIGIKLVWAAGFLGSWLLYDAPRGWLGAATWVVFAALVHLISGWPEVTSRIELPE
jgi:hypothetical protein